MCLMAPTARKRSPTCSASRSQLIVYHFMLGPGWTDGCPSCSFLADHFDGAAIHLAQRDVTLVVVSRAPLAEIEAYKKRMGWKFKWVSSFGTDFNHDFHVSFTPEEKARGKVEYNYTMTEFPSEEAPGLSGFIKDGGAVFHTYSSYARGLDILIGAYNFLDFAPRGRDEAGLPYSMAWVRRHDEYARRQGKLLSRINEAANAALPPPKGATQMPLPITAAYAAVLALLVVVLGVNVTMHRVKLGVPIGDGGNAEMRRMIRLHGNAAEYIPLALVLMAIYEVNGGWHIALNIFGVALIVARLMQTWDMWGNDVAGFGRKGGQGLTWLTIAALAVLNIVTIV